MSLELIGNETLSLLELLQELNDFEGHFVDEINRVHERCYLSLGYPEDHKCIEEAFNTIRTLLKLKIADELVSDLG